MTKMVIKSWQMYDKILKLCLKFAYIIIFLMIIYRSLGDCMIEKLKIKAIYDDFLKNVTLTDEQVKILNMMIKKETTVKISMEIGACQRTITHEIKKIKDLYKDYCNWQLSKALLLIK